MTRFNAYATCHVPLFRRAVLTGVICSLAAITSASKATAAYEGDISSMHLDLAPDGIFGALTVVSDDGEKWNRIAPGEISTGGQVQITLAHGQIRQFSIYLGVCSKRNCFEGIGTPLLGSIERKKNYGKELDVEVSLPLPASKFPVSTATGIAPSPYGDQIVAACNAALSQGKTIDEGHNFTFHAPVTLGVDSRGWKPRIDLTFGSLGGGVLPLGIFEIKDVDFSHTFHVDVPVKCKPFSVGVKAPPKILEADLGVNASGICPKPSTARVIIAAEAPRAVFYKIERADGTTTTADWIQGEIKIQNNLMGGKSPWMDAEHALDKLDPGTSKFRLWIDGWGKTPWRTVNVECPPFEVMSAWLKYDVEDKATCPKKVVETATFYTNRPGMVPYEIKHHSGLVLRSGQVEAKRDGDKYIAVHTRLFPHMGGFQAQIMADVKNSPANSGWVPLKIDCLEALSGKLTLQSLGAASCKGEALVAIHTDGTGELPYELECGPGKSWQRKVTAMANKIGVDKVQFDVTNNEQVTCVLRTRIGGVLKPLDGASKTFQCHKPIDVDASTDLVPDTPPDPQKPGKPDKVVDPVKPNPQQPDKPSIVVVDLPRPTISCANGKVKGDACECEPHFKPVKAGKNAWRCVRSTVDPKPEKPIVSEPKISCAGGTVKNGACTCARTHKPVKAGKDAWRCTRSWWSTRPRTEAALTRWR